jgi:hypothetical protein
VRIADVLIDAFSYSPPFLIPCFFWSAGFALSPLFLIPRHFLFPAFSGSLVLLFPRFFLFPAFSDLLLFLFPAFLILRFSYSPLFFIPRYFVFVAIFPLSLPLPFLSPFSLCISPLAIFPRDSPRPASLLPLLPTTPHHH